MASDKIGFIDKACMFLILGMFALCTYSYSTLPDIIPLHFSVKATPDGYGSKKMLWLLPAIALVNYLIMRWAAKFSLSASPDSLRKWGSRNRGKSDAFIKRRAAYSSVQMTYLNLISIALLSYLCYLSVTTAHGILLPFSAIVLWTLAALFMIPIFNLLKFQWTEKEE